jgi:TolB-like protein/Tfp pilus assembly protein PilF
MASIIPGYEYDIFISYRQKDNKHDGWVTEFVNNLKGELEATFKEDISVYFDINPHDGLLETHDVDASLKEKLKCLVFIPIISRTYCDPKSFAWGHEFKAFVELASQDQYGLKVKVTGGNVATRVLPIQIHDLNADDRKLVECELGGYLRGIEFIYKEPGVNRPLAPDDDEKKNLNGVKYKNQINKVANAINEIIDGLKNSDPSGKVISDNSIEKEPSGKINHRKKIIIGALIVLTLIVAGYFIVSKLFEPQEEHEKSIAILPFKLLSDEPDKQYLADGMMDAITLHLSKIKDLRVMSRTSVEQYRGTTKTLRVIGQELNVEYLLEGSFQKFGDNARLIVQLIKASEERHAWANEYNRNWREVFSVQSEVAKTIARELHVVISPEEVQLIEKPPTTSLIAYDFYQRGRVEYTKYLIDNNNIEALPKAENLFHKALKYDSTFAQAYTGLAGVYRGKYYYKEYFSQNFLDSTLILANIALSFDDQLAEAYYVRGDYYIQKGFTKQAIEEFGKTIKFNPNDWMAYYGKGNLYFDDDLLKSIENFQIAASLNHGSELPLILVGLGKSYFSAGIIEKTKDISIEFLKLLGDSPQYLGYLAQIEYYQGDYENALEFLRKGYTIDSTDVGILEAFGFCYSFLDQFKESLKYYKKYVETKKALGQFDLEGTQRIGYAYWKNGYRKEAEYYFDKQIEICKSSIQNNRPFALSKQSYYELAGVYAFIGDKEKAYENLRIFNQRKIMELYRVTIIKHDPLFNSIRNEPEFLQIAKDVEAKYQAEHERVRKWLEEQGML